MTEGEITKYNNYTKELLQRRDDHIGTSYSTTPINITEFEYTYSVNGKKYKSKRISYPNISTEDLMIIKDIGNGINFNFPLIFQQSENEKINVYYCEYLPSLSVLKRNIQFNIKNIIPFAIVIVVFLLSLWELKIDLKRSTKE